MPPRTRFIRGVGRGAKRHSTWLEIVPTFTAFTATGGTILNSLNTDEEQKRPFTIVRTYLEVLIKTDQLVAVEIQIGAIGLAVVSDQAEQTGVAAVPTPVSNADSDLWFVHQWLLNAFDFGDATGFQGSDGRLYSIDSKAMRKVNDNENVVLVGEFSSVGAGFTLMVAGRMLIKES